MRTLIIYATGEGQTEKVATHISVRLGEKGFPSDVYNINADNEAPVALDSYDAVIVGAPIHYSHYDARLAEYLGQYREALQEIPSAFFSISLGILSDQESEQAEVRQITDAYLAKTHWKPFLTTHFAGALVFSKYGWFKRRLMQWIAKKAGGPTDATFDYEFTNWPQVDEFVNQFVAFVNSCKLTDSQPRQSISMPHPHHRQYSVKNRQASSI